MKWLVVLLAFAMASAGCSDAGNETEEGQGMVAPGADGATDMVVEEGTTDPFADAPPAPTGWLLDDDETIFEGAPEEDVEEEFPLGSIHKAVDPHLGPYTFYDGVGSAYDHDLLITEASADLTVRHKSASADPTAALGFGGIGYGLLHSGSGNALSLRPSPNQAYGPMGEASWNDEDVALPPGGFVVPAGENIHFVTGSAYVTPTDETEGAVLLMNSEGYPSGVTATTEWIVLPEAKEPERIIDESKTFTAAGCGDSAAEGGSKFTFPVEITDDVAYIYTEATSTDGRDIDLYVVAGGEQMAANSPFGFESLQVHPPNVDAMGGPGTFNVEIRGCAGDEDNGYPTVDIIIDVAMKVSAEGTE